MTSEIKQKQKELNWSDIFLSYFLINTIFPGLVFLTYGYFLDKYYKGDSPLLVSFGVIAALITIIGFLSFLYVSIVKIVGIKSNDSQDIDSNNI